MKMADQVAAKHLTELNRTDLSKKLGGPFLLEDYDKTVRQETAEGRRYFAVYYGYGKPVGFLGHPAHFAAWVDRDTGQARLIGGR